MPSIDVHINLNQIQTRTNLGHKPQWKKWRQIQNLLVILVKLFSKAKLKSLLKFCTQPDLCILGLALPIVKQACRNVESGGGRKRESGIHPFHSPCSMAAMAMQGVKLIYNPKSQYHQ